ncbi:MAG: lysophospholipid acyltransferase family protein [Betaproteobacteria bacterium]|nr:lysophospholipid acyltransferase family protein [Betaproteobacteria bacterium]
MALARATARAPLCLIHAAGALLGWVAWLASPGYRRVLRTNLERAFPGAPAALRRSAVAHAGRMMAELPRMWLRPQAESAALVTAVSGWELVDDARRRGRAPLFLTPHLGCFEVTPKYYAMHGPITVMFRPPRQPWLRPLMEAGRHSATLTSVPADVGGVRRMVRALRGGEAVGLLPDQVPGAGEGQWAPYFGRPAYTMTLAARLAQMDNVELLLAWAERLPRGAGYHLHLKTPSAPLPADLPQAVAALNRELEALVRACPAQYLWGYNRYKAPAGVARPPEAR